MKQISIRKEGLPVRCEICHQADCFDHISNFCSRCAGLSQPLSIVVENKVVRNSKKQNKLFFTLPIYLGVTAGVLMSIIPANFSLMVFIPIAGASGPKSYYWLTYRRLKASQGVVMGVITGVCLDLTLFLISAINGPEANEFSFLFFVSPIVIIVTIITSLFTVWLLNSEG